MSEHPIAQKIIDSLEEVGAWYETFVHEHVRTSEEAAALRENYTLAEGAKALIVRVKIKGEGKKFVMLVIPGDVKFDAGKVKNLLNSVDVRFAFEHEVEQITHGVKPGGVPPFGNLFGIDVVADRKVFEHQKIIFNAGRNYSIAMLASDYRDIVKPKVADIS